MDVGGIAGHGSGGGIVSRCGGGGIAGKVLCGIAGHRGGGIARQSIVGMALSGRVGIARLYGHRSAATRYQSSWHREVT